VVVGAAAALRLSDPVREAEALSHALREGHRAVEELDRLVTLGEAYAYAYEQALKTSMTTLAGSQHASVEWSIRLGAALREVGRTREAATVLEAARNAGVDDVELSQNLATAYAALGRTSEARALFESVAAAEHAPATAWYNLGLVELQSGRKQEAARAFRRAVERDPSYGDAWNGLGASLVERDAAAATEAWRTAEKLLPRDYDLLFNVAMLIADHRPANEAVPYLRRFVAEAPRPQYERDITRVEQRLKAIESRSK